MAYREIPVARRPTPFMLQQHLLEQQRTFQQQQQQNNSHPNSGNNNNMNSGSLQQPQPQHLRPQNGAVAVAAAPVPAPLVVPPPQQPFGQGTGFNRSQHRDQTDQHHSAGRGVHRTSSNSDVAESVALFNGLVSVVAENDRARVRARIAEAGGGNGSGGANSQNSQNSASSRARTSANQNSNNNAGTRRTRSNNNNNNNNNNDGGGNNNNNNNNNNRHHPKMPMTVMGGNHIAPAPHVGKMPPPPPPPPGLKVPTRTLFNAAAKNNNNNNNSSSSQNNPPPVTVVAPSTATDSKNSNLKPQKNVPPPVFNAQAQKATSFAGVANALNNARNSAASTSSNISTSNSNNNNRNQNVFVDLVDDDDDDLMHRKPHHQPPADVDDFSAFDNLDAPTTKTKARSYNYSAVGGPAPATTASSRATATTTLFEALAHNQQTATSSSSSSAAAAAKKGSRNSSGSSATANKASSNSTRFGNNLLRPQQTPRDRAELIVQEMQHADPSIRVCSSDSDPVAHDFIARLRATENERKAAYAAWEADPNGTMETRPHQMIRVSLGAFTDKLVRPTLRCKKEGSYGNDQDEGIWNEGDDDENNNGANGGDNNINNDGQQQHGGINFESDDQASFAAGRGYSYPTSYLARLKQRQDTATTTTRSEIAAAAAAAANGIKKFTPSIGIESNFSMWEMLQEERGSADYVKQKPNLIFDMYPPSTAIDRLLVVVLCFHDRWESSSEQQQQHTIAFNNGPAGIDFIIKLRKIVKFVDYVVFNSHAILMPLLSHHCRRNQAKAEAAVSSATASDPSLSFAPHAGYSVPTGGPFSDDFLNPSVSPTTASAKPVFGFPSSIESSRHFNDIRFLAKQVLIQDSVSEFQSIALLLIELGEDLQKRMFEVRRRQMQDEGTISRGDLEAEYIVPWQGFQQQPSSNNRGGISSNNNNNSNSNISHFTELTKDVIRVLENSGSDTVRGMLLRLSLTDEVFCALEYYLEKYGLHAAYRRCDKQIPVIIAKMKYGGIAINVDHIKAVDVQIRARIDELQREILKTIPKDTAHFCRTAPFNMDSPADVRTLLFDILKLDVHLDPKKPHMKTGKTKKWSTGKEVLEELMEKHPVVALIAKYRKTVHCYRTYFHGTFRTSYPIDDWIQQQHYRHLNNRHNNSSSSSSNNSLFDVDSQNIVPSNNNNNNNISTHPIRVVHCNFLQDGTETGRFSCNEPNLQNLPRVRENDETGFSSHVRRAFVALRPDHVIVAFDYEQLELRVLANLSEDNNLIETLNDPEIERSDVHRRIAAVIFNKQFHEVSNDERARAKEVVYGTLYGMQAPALAARLNCSHADAIRLQSKFHTAYPGVSAYRQKILNDCRRQGYIQMLTGHRRWIREINDHSNHYKKLHAERKAFNSTVQGTAAGLMRKAMVDIDQKFMAPLVRRDEVFLMLQVHDELVFSMHRDMVGQHAAAIRQLMEMKQAGGGPKVPYLVKVSKGENFADLHVIVLDTPQATGESSLRTPVKQH